MLYIKMEIESAKLGLLRILEKLPKDPEKANALLKEFRAYVSGKLDQSDKSKKWENVLIIGMIEIIKTFHEINQKQNKEIEKLQIDLNNALERINKLEQKKPLDDPESLK